MDFPENKNDQVINTSAPKSRLNTTILAQKLTAFIEKLIRRLTNRHQKARQTQQLVQNLKDFPEKVIRSSTSWLQNARQTLQNNKWNCQRKNTIPVQSFQCTERRRDNKRRQDTKTLTYKKELQNTITKTYLYNFDPLKLLFNIVKLGLTGVCTIFLISAQKHWLWILVMFWAEIWRISEFFIWKFLVFGGEIFYIFE